MSKLLGFPGGSVVKNSAIQEPQEMQVQSLGEEDPQKEGMATHSHILVWRISWTEETGGLQSMRSRRVGHYYHFSMQSTSKSLMSNLNDVCVCAVFEIDLQSIYLDYWHFTGSTATHGP